MQSESYIGCVPRLLGGIPSTNVAPAVTKARPARKLLLILAVIVLLPALFYSAYEISTLSMNEQMMTSLYDRQLDIILFSLNQYTFDIANNWAGSVSTLFDEQPGTGRFDAALQRFLRRTPAVDALVLLDTLGQVPLLFGRGDSAGLAPRVIGALRQNGEIIDRINRYKRLEYRRIEPIVLGDSTAANEILLLFPLESEKLGERLGGMVVNGQSFVPGVLGPRLSGASGEEFSTAVVRSASDSVLFSTAPVNPREFRQKRSLWLFPGYSLGNLHPRTHRRTAGPLEVLPEPCPHPAPRPGTDRRSLDGVQERPEGNGTGPDEVRFCLECVA